MSYRKYSGSLTDGLWSLKQSGNEITSVTFNNRQAIRFNQKKSSHISSRRSEASLSRRPIHQDIWYGVSYYLPNNNWINSSSDEWRYIMQIHARPDTEIDPATGKKEVWRHPCFGLMIADGRFKVLNAWDLTKIQTDRKNVEIYTKVLGDVPIGRWVNFVIGAYWHHLNGWVSVWQDGQLVWEKQGSVYYNDDKSPGSAFQHGIYCDKTYTEDFELYTSNIIQVEGKDKFNDVFTQESGTSTPFVVAPEPIVPDPVQPSDIIIPNYDGYQAKIKYENKNL